MVKITKIEENGNGVDVSLDNGRKHWVSNDAWSTKEELKKVVKSAENYINRKNIVSQKKEMKELVGEEL